MDFKWWECVNRFLIATNSDAGNGGGYARMEEVMQEKYGKSLYFPHNFAMNLNLLSEIKFKKCFKKW